MTYKPIYRITIDQLPVTVYQTNEEMGCAAAEQASAIIQEAIRERNVANIILATGNSQLSFLSALRQDKDVAWDKVYVFHMDEYIGIDPNHPASFPLFLQKHFLNYLHPKDFYPVPATKDAKIACAEYEHLLHVHPADLCALGYGENGHLAFNDPPFADFNDPVWVKIVKLDEASRRQQVGEGHFPNLASVPTHAMTLTIPALLAAKNILALVPEARKADAVAKALLGPITEDCPGSILRRAPQAQLFLDRESASKLGWGL
jgi:glucosamine-6-phosphate deaminase